MRPAGPLVVLVTPSSTLRRGGVAALAAILLASCGGAAEQIAAPESQMAPPPAEINRLHDSDGATSRAPEADEKRPPVRPVAIAEGPRGQRRVALTFDADMTSATFAEVRAGASQYERAIIRKLRRENVPATIFVTGLWAKAYPNAIRELAADPLFELGNHTYDHAAWTSDCYGLPAISDRADKKRQLDRTAAVLERLSGSAPRWFRFPGLCHERADVELVASRDEQVVDGLTSADAFATDPAAVEDAVLSTVEPGSIIVMHLNGAPNAPVTADALDGMIPALRERGYDFVSLSDLLRDR